MLIPPQLRQLDRRQDPGDPNIGGWQPRDSDINTNNDNNSTNSGTGQGSSGAGKNNGFIIGGAVVVFVVALTVMLYFVLRALRRMNCRPKYIPGKFLKEKWRRWNVGASYGQVPDAASSNQTANTAPTQRTARETQMNSNATVRRDTSIRSIITLPPYSFTPKPEEQVIAREGEREGMDVVIEFPETAEEEEARREETMEGLYQIRVQRRQEIAERQARREERRVARERGDIIRLEQLRTESRARARSRASANGSNTNASAAAALAEHQNRGRDRRISSVSYAELGYVRHDGSRMRASSRDSDSRPLLSNTDGTSTGGPDRSSALISVHSRGESYSSTLSLATGGSDGESLTPVQSHATSTHSVGRSNGEPDDGDMGSQAIPPPHYDHLDWGDAPPYEATVSTPNSNSSAPQLRELTPIPSIQIDIASPVSNTPTTPTNAQREEHPAHELPTEPSSHSNTSNNASTAP